MTIKLIVGTANPVLNTPQRDIMLVPGSLTYWQSDCALRCAKRLNSLVILRESPLEAKMSAC